MSSAPLLLHVFPTFAVGGSQARFATLANHFGPKYRHAIVALDGVYDCERRLTGNVEARRWNVDAQKRATFSSIFAFRKVLRKRSPDLLLTYNWGSIEWALANRPQIVPHIHIEDGFGPEEADRQLPRRILARRVALANSTVVLPSRTLHRLALDRWRLPADRVCYIPNGIDVARYEKKSNPVSLPCGEGPVVGTVAGLRAEKNIGRLLRAFQAVRERAHCRLVIAGDGPQRGELERMAAQILLPGSYAFLGQMEATECVYAALDVFALSSDTEQMPTSLMEAMAAGLPVAATNVGDVHDMVATENMPFVTPRNDREFSNALHRLSVDRALRTSVGRSNRGQARARFNIAAMFAKYDSLFERKLEGSTN